MRDEVNSAVDFLGNILLSSRTHTLDIDHALVEQFRQNLQVVLCTHYHNHWFPEKPFKGSAYRCLRINGKMDPLLAKAGEACGLSCTDLYTVFPRELTMWVDPKEVSYRIGEEGSVGVLYEDDSSSSQNDAQFQSIQSESQQQPQQQQQQCAGEFRLTVPSYGPDIVNMEYLAQFAN